MGKFEVAAMGADAGAAGLGVMLARGGQGLCQFGFGLKRRHTVEHRLDTALKADLSPRERPDTGAHHGDETA